ncbi:DUF5658 family protein [Cohnella yongneupensis]|uniref:DUF5658 family protein n=1 Tax=Cohnella yongneupensis TaxID=425006 RepID=A0ABW0R7C6_9BACL
MRLFLIMFITVAGGLDAWLTQYGVRRGLIEEANPWMDWLFGRSEFLFFLLKIGLPLALLAIVPKRLSMPLRGALALACVTYLFVMAVHGYWITELLI